MFSTKSWNQLKWSIDIKKNVKKLFAQTSSFLVDTHTVPTHLRCSIHLDGIPSHRVPTRYTRSAANSNLEETRGNESVRDQPFAPHLAFIKNLFFPPPSPSPSPLQVKLRRLARNRRPAVIVSRRANQSTPATEEVRVVFFGVHYMKKMNQTKTGVRYYDKWATISR